MENYNKNKLKNVQRMINNLDQYENTLEYEKSTNQLDEIQKIDLENFDKEKGSI